jgi:L-ascorbate metabolism protein UlaG (beta-lactamase superfamily)
VQFLVAPRSRHANDESSMRELAFERGGAELPRGLSLTWLGTAGFVLRHQDYTLLIDPYLSRAPLASVLSKRALVWDANAIKTTVPRADAVVVGHTHFDHALDIAPIARTSGCKVYGSTSLAGLMQLHGLGHLSVRVEVGRRYELGPFEVTFVRSRHSKLLFGLRVPSEGELTCDQLDGLSAGQFRCGEVYGIHIRVAGATFYHQGSADIIEENVFDHSVDFFLAGIAGRGFTRDYTARALRTLAPSVIIPHHYDNFFLPLQGPMGFSLNVNFGGFVEEVARVSRDFMVRTLTPLRTLEGGAG